MSSIPSNSLYPEPLKDEFCLEYYKNGSLRATANQLGIPWDTTKSWAKTEWFKSRMLHIRKEADRAMDRKLTNLIESGFKEMEDRIVNGEERVDKNGNVVTVKSTLSSLTIAVGTMFDKRATLRKDVVVEDDTANKLNSLADTLKKMAVDSKPTIEVTDVIISEANTTVGLPDDSGVSDEVPKE